MAADVGAQPRVGPKPPGKPDIGRDVEQQAGRSARSAIGHFVARGGGAVVHGIGEAALGVDARGARDPMQAEPQRQAAVQAGSNRDAQIGDGAIARDFVGDRLLHPTQVDRVVDDDAERAIEIRREPTAHYDAARDRSGDHHRRETRPDERRLGGTGIDRTPRRAAREAGAHAPHVREHRIGQRREGVERRERATGGARAHALPFAGRSEPANTELGVLGGQTA